MKNKFLIAFLVAVMVIPFSLNVFALSYNELLARLNSIKGDVASMKDEYNEMLETYSSVIEALSDENKENAKTLVNNLMAEDVKQRVNSIKSELSQMGGSEAEAVLAKIENLESDAKTLIEENEDVVEDVKNGYEDLSVNEVKEIVNKVNEITTSLGYNPDTTAEYNTLVGIIDDAHQMALAINDKLEDFLKNNIDSYEEVASFDLAKKLFNAAKTKDREKVLDVLRETLNSSSNESKLRNELDDIKQDVKALKAKLKEANELDEKVLIAFDSTKKNNISNKVKQIELDYIDFAKLLVNNYSEDYTHVTALLARDESVDTMIDYANKALDYLDEYKDTIKSWTKKSKTQAVKDLNLPTEVREVVEKAGLLVALGFADIPNVNEDYIFENFQDEIDKVTDIVTDELEDYANYIDELLKKEVQDEIKKSSVEIAQENVRKINSPRFKTIEDIKALKARLENEVLNKSSRFNSIKSKVNKVAPYAYDIYYNNILDTIEKIMLLENDKTSKLFEFNLARQYVLFDKFASKEEFESVLGIDENYNNVMHYDDLKNGLVKTESLVSIDLSDSVYGEYDIAVLGDVHPDGKINSQDYMRIKNHVMETDTLTGLKMIAADTYRDGKIDSRDYMKIKNFVMNNQKITL